MDFLPSRSSRRKKKNISMSDQSESKFRFLLSYVRSKVAVRFGLRYTWFYNFQFEKFRLLKLRFVKLENSDGSKPLMFLLTAVLYCYCIPIQSLGHSLIIACFAARKVRVFLKLHNKTMIDEEIPPWKEQFKLRSFMMLEAFQQLYCVRKQTSYRAKRIRGCQRAKEKYFSLFKSNALTRIFSSTLSY